MKKTSKFKELAGSKLFTLLILLAAIVIFFEIASPNHVYLKVSNIKNILNTMVIFLLFTIAEGLLLISGAIDLSTGYIGLLSGSMLASLLAHTNVPWFIAVALCILVGILFGLFNALLINELSLQGFIATLATGSFIARGLAFIISNGKAIPIDDEAIVWLGTGKIGNFIPITIIFSLLLLLIFGIILAKTKYGRSIYLCGGNSIAARLAGLNPKKLSYSLYAISGALGAIAGILYVSRLQSGNLTGTSNYAFPAITAAILGGVAIVGGSGNMLGCFIGLLIINAFNNGLTVLGVSPHWQSVASGVLLLLALTLDFFSNRYMKGSRADQPASTGQRFRKLYANLSSHEGRKSK